MDSTLIRMENTGFVYKRNIAEADDVKAIDRVNLTIEKGSFTAIIGRNGSGKSTLAKLMNALLLPEEGTVHVLGIITTDEGRLWEIRRNVGMVFQNPDNQIVGTTVEEDVAFGPENIGIEPAEIRKRVDSAMETVGMSRYAGYAPHLLSGGQKQRVAIAGILALKPTCIVLDEATSMLDPSGRKEVMDVLRQINHEEGITIVHITHHMDEASLADRVIVIDNGRVVLDGTPRQVFSRVEEVKSLGLDVPMVTELFHELNLRGYRLPEDVLGTGEAYEILSGMLAGRE
jgi:energy-coupling factor transport system ATP-binding protein